MADAYTDFFQTLLWHHTAKMHLVIAILWQVSLHFTHLVTLNICQFNVNFVLDSIKA